MSVTTRTAGTLMMLWLTAVAAQPPQPGESRTAAGDGAPALRGEVRDVLSQARSCARDGDFECARRRVERLAARGDLSSYERGMTAQFSAFVNYEQGRVAQALEDYETLLAQPNLPDGLERDTLYTASRLHRQRGEPERALEKLERWFALTDDASSAAYVLRAQIHYELERWAEGAAAIHEALRLAERSGEPPKESWHQLAAVFEYQLGGCERALETFETLMRHWPKRDYYVQAAGCAGKLGDTERQLALMDTAAAQGLLGARASFSHALMLMSAERYEDAKSAVDRGTRLLRLPADHAVREDFERTAELIVAGRNGEAVRALKQGIERLDASGKESGDSP